MPSHSDHVEQYKHNKDFSRKIDAGYADWYVTVAFYCCVHIVEAVLSKENKHSDQHVDRSEFIDDNPILSGIKDQYRSLYSLSRKGRYFCVPMRSADSYHAQCYLEDIEACIVKYMDKQ